MYKIQELLLLGQWVTRFETRLAEEAAVRLAAFTAVGVRPRLFQGVGGVPTEVYPTEPVFRLVYVV